MLGLFRTARPRQRGENAEADKRPTLRANKLIRRTPRARANAGATAPAAKAYVLSVTAAIATKSELIAIV